MLEEHAAGRMENIALFLPVIELRLNIFGGTESKLSKVNYHVIFSDDLQPQVIREQFVARLSSRFQLQPRYKNTTIEKAWSGTITKDALKSLGKAIISSVPNEEQKHYDTALIEGFNNLTVSLDIVSEALRSSFIRDRFVTAVGKTEWADVKWKDGSIADKKHTINFADCVFIAAESPTMYQRAKRSLSNAGVNDKLIDCSDAHHLPDSNEKDRIGNCMTWMKADLTFAGLLQVLQEFEHRVFVGEIPPQIQRYHEHPSRYMAGVQIKKKPSSDLEETWFDVDLPLNSGLVTIIGNKGSGKSALAEIIGLAGGSPHEKHFSFLNPSKFRDSRQRLASHFITHLIWKDRDDDEVSLDCNVEPGTKPLVQHLPQKFLETLCNEVPRGEKTQFDLELENIIFSHLSIERRLGASSLSELIHIMSKPLETQLKEIREEIRRINSDVVRIEEDLSVESIRSKKQFYGSLRREWLELKSSPPKEIPEPEILDPELSKIRGEIQEQSTARLFLKERWDTLTRELADLRRDQAELKSLRSELETLQRKYKELILINIDLMTRIGIPKDFSSFTIDNDKLDKARNELSQKEAALSEELDHEKERGLPSVLNWIDEYLESLRAKLSAPAERREQYLKQLQDWNQELRSLLGKSNNPDSLLGLRKVLENLRLLPEKLKQLKQTRLEKTLQIHALLKQQATIYSDLYEPLENYMNQQQIPSEYKLSIGTSLVDTCFTDVFLEQLINRHALGSFCGISESLYEAASILGATDFDSKDKIKDFVCEIDNRLHADYRILNKPSIEVKTQVRKGKTPQDVYNFVFGLEYLSPRYGLNFGDKPIYQLSPGEKGTLLLIFFLLAELNTTPLVIDQPEDNLDNNTVYRALVECFHQAKLRRQVLIVTHNPNLAVVCDSDQIIVASMDKGKENRISYESGAIENPRIIRAIIDILEGTHPAFDNRSIKYTLHRFGEMTS